MNYIIVDVEATCWKDRKPERQSEIIEIGALKLDKTGNTISEFNNFVKPILNPVLSDFCKQLTNIQQADIDTANTFDIVIKFKVVSQKVYKLVF